MLVFALPFRVVMCSISSALLKSYLKLCKGLVPLFISRQGNRVAGQSVRRMIGRRKEEAGVNSRGKTHAFRRSCASHMLKHGAPLPAIQRMLGHEYLDTTENYAVVADEDLREKYISSHPGALEVRNE